MQGFSTIQQNHSIPLPNPTPPIQTGCLVVLPSVSSQAMPGINSEPGMTSQPSQYEPQSPIQPTKKSIKKAIGSTVQTWLSNNFYPELSTIQANDQRDLAYGLMGQILEYMVNRYYEDEKWRQNWQSAYQSCLLRTEKIAEVIRNKEQREGLAELETMKNVVASLKFIANHLCGNGTANRTFLAHLIECQHEEIHTIVLGKLAFVFDDDDSSLSVFSEQSFDPNFFKQRFFTKQQIPYRQIPYLLSQDQVNTMKRRLAEVRSPVLRDFLIKNLIDCLEVSDRKLLKQAENTDIIKEHNESGQKIIGQCRNYNLFWLQNKSEISNDNS